MAWSVRRDLTNRPIDASVGRLVRLVRWSICHNSLKMRAGSLTSMLTCSLNQFIDKFVCRSSLQKKSFIFPRFVKSRKISRGLFCTLDLRRVSNNNFILLPNANCIKFMEEAGDDLEKCWSKGGI